MSGADGAARLRWEGTASYAEERREEADRAEFEAWLAATFAGLRKGGDKGSGAMFALGGVR